MYTCVQYQDKDTSYICKYVKQCTSTSTSSVVDADAESEEKKAQYLIRRIEIEAATGHHHHCCHTRSFNTSKLTTFPTPVVRPSLIINTVPTFKNSGRYRKRNLHTALSPRISLGRSLKLKLLSLFPVNKFDIKKSKGHK